MLSQNIRNIPWRNRELSSIKKKKIIIICTSIQKIPEKVGIRLWDRKVFHLKSKKAAFLG